LPYFLKDDSRLTRLTAESVAEFYRGVIWKDLERSPETQRELGLEGIFDEIYQESKYTDKVDEYMNKLKQYAIITIADKRSGPISKPSVHEMKRKMISEVATDPRYFWNIFRFHNRDFDPLWNLDSRVIEDTLLYCSNAVKRALEAFSRAGISYEGKGRSLIDTTLLTGFWTPQGLVDRARLAAEGKIDRHI
jgi:hypothetical protein